MLSGENNPKNGPRLRFNSPLTQGEHEPDHVPAVKHEVQGPSEGRGGEDQGRLRRASREHAGGFQKP